MLPFLKGAPDLPGVQIHLANNGFIVTVRAKGPPAGTLGQTITALLANFAGKLPEELNQFQDRMAHPQATRTAESEMDPDGVAPPPGSAEAAYHHFDSQMQRIMEPFARLVASGEEQIFVFSDPVQLLEFLSSLFIEQAHPEMETPDHHTLEGEGGSGHPPPPEFGTTDSDDDTPAPGGFEL